MRRMIMPFSNAKKALIMIELNTPTLPGFEALNHVVHPRLLTVLRQLHPGGFNDVSASRPCDVAQLDSLRSAPEHGSDGALSAGPALHIANGISLVDTRGALLDLNEAAERYDVVAAIFPRSILKRSIIERINPYLHLLYQETVASPSPKGRGGILQVWEKRADFRQTQPRMTFHSDFDFTTRENADIAVQRSGPNAGRLLDSQQLDEDATPFFLKAIECSTESMISHLKEIDFGVVYANTASTYSLAKSELVELYDDVKRLGAKRVEQENARLNGCRPNLLPRAGTLPCLRKILSAEEEEALKPYDTALGDNPNAVFERTEGVLWEGCNVVGTMFHSLRHDYHPEWRNFRGLVRSPRRGEWGYFASGLVQAHFAVTFQFPVLSDGTHAGAARIVLETPDKLLEQNTVGDYWEQYMLDTYGWRWLTQTQFPYVRWPTSILEPQCRLDRRLWTQIL
ncbi:hypothetical protein QCN27_19745 [Cereibacter sp. SYSU M97828]|nr:hypothetical protein [Cereibacter flavus]